MRARYVVHWGVQSRVAGRYPFGTVVVNVTGSIALGFLTGLFLYHGLESDPRVIIGTGFLGAYTTFSSFSFETFGLLRSDASVATLVDTFGSVVIGLVAAAAGIGLAGVF